MAVYQHSLPICCSPDQSPFSNLIDHLLPILHSIEVAATLTRKRAMAKTGLPADKIGIIFISPCPSKVTYVKSPLGTTAVK